MRRGSGDWSAHAGSRGAQVERAPRLRVRRRRILLASVRRLTPLRMCLRMEYGGFTAGL